ncbi:MAG: molybdenum cofactor biosynthesis protein MoaE [Gammaproteobacteria bacterium]|nr:molybdenum cofactor biosynthesis protein MoaE [Gammaproteobacteria bacterium]
MTIFVRETPLDPWAELAAYQNQRAATGGYGATAVFVGTLRDFNQGETVTGMTLEHYPGMTEKYLDAICAEAMQRWPIIDALIVHRTGAVAPGDSLVLAAVWAVHRAEAFAACRYLVEELKTRAPLWKREQVGEAARWVEHNTPG